MRRYMGRSVRMTVTKRRNTRLLRERRIKWRLLRPGVFFWSENSGGKGKLRFQRSQKNVNVYENSRQADLHYLLASWVSCAVGNGSWIESKPRKSPTLFSPTSWSCRMKWKPARVVFWKTFAFCRRGQALKLQYRSSSTCACILVKVFLLPSLYVFSVVGLI